MTPEELEALPQRERVKVDPTYDPRDEGEEEAGLSVEQAMARRLYRGDAGDFIVAMDEDGNVLYRRDRVEDPHAHLSMQPETDERAASRSEYLGDD